MGNGKVRTAQSTDHDRFVENWLGGSFAPRGQRRRLMAVLRNAHRVLGLGRKKLGLGLLGASPSARASLFAGVAATAMPLATAFVGAGAALAQANDVTLGDSANADGTTAAPAIAIGFSAEAINTGTYNVQRQDGQGFNDASNSYGGTAVGAYASASRAGSAFGARSEASGLLAVAIGQNSTSAGTSSVAMGTAAYATATHSLAVGFQNLASGDRSTAIGPVSTASGAESIAIGLSAEANGQRAIAFGASPTGSIVQDQTTNTEATGLDSIAFGTSAKAVGFDTVAIGTGSNAIGNTSMALGDGAAASGSRDIYIGSEAGTGGQGTNIDNIGMGALAGQNVDGDNNYAFGANAGNDVVGRGNASLGLQTGQSVTGEFNVALGSSAGSNVTGNNNVALGLAAGSGQTANDTIAVGTSAAAEADDAIAVGSRATANATNDIAMGTDATATGNANGSALSIGAENTATGAGAVALGDPTTATGDGAVAQGLDSTATGDGTVAIGNTANAGGGGQGVSTPGTAAQGAVSIGYQTQAVGQGSVALGNASTAQGAGSLAMGDGANATVDGGVALGSASVADTAAGIAGYVPSGADATAIAGTQSTLGAVSVGDAASGEYRQITGVAAGTADSDAVNVAQLQAVEEVANTGFNVQANGDVATNVAPGDTVQYLDGTNIEITRSGTDITVATADDLVADSLTTGDTVVNTAGVTVDDGTSSTSLAANGVTIAGGPSITTAGVDAGGQTITNVAPGMIGTDAVNLDQLEASVTHYFSVNDGGTAGGNFANDGAVDPNAIAIGVDALSEGDRSVALGYGASTAQIDSIAFGTGATTQGQSSVAIGDGASNDVFGNNQIALGTDAATFGEGDVAIGHNSQASGQNNVALGVSATTAVGMVNGVAIGNEANVNTDGSVAIGDAAAVTTANSVALGAGSVADGDTVGDPAYQPLDGSGAPLPVAGASPVGVVSVGDTGGERRITNLAAGSADTDAVNVSQLQAVEQVANAGFNVQANGDTATNVAPGDTVQYLDGTNIEITRSGTDITVATADDLVADSLTTGNTVTDTDGVTVDDGTNSTSLAADGVTIAGGPSITTAGVDAGGLQVTNVADGAVNATSTDAINGSQLFATNQDVAQNTTNIAGNTTDIAALDGRVTTNEGDIANNAADITEVGDVVTNIAGDTSASYLAANGDGIRYARTNEDGLAETDAFAQGVGSTALGYQATASAADSVTVGSNSEATIDGSVALGSGSLSDRAIAPATGQIAAGSTVVEYNTSDQTLLGAVSVGDDTAGNETYRQITNVADGTESQDAVTIRQLQGAIASVSVTPTRYFHANSSAVDSLAVGQESIAIGPTTVVNGDNGVGIGNGARVGMAAPGGTAIGNEAEVLEEDAIALGTQSLAAGEQSIAIGPGAQANHALSLALGAGAETSVGGEVDYAAYGLATPQTSIGEVSFGNAGQQRKLTNVAAGSADTDAVNVSQLGAVDARIDDLGDRAVVYDGAPGDDKDQVTLAGTEGTTITNLADGDVSEGSSDAVNGSQLYAVSDSVANHLGGGSTVNPDGTISAPEYIVQGNTYNTVGDSLTALDNGITNVRQELTDINNGAGIKYFHANSALPDSAATGTNSVAVGPNSVAGGDSSLAAGNGAVASEQGAVAIGQGAQATNANDVALGSGSVTEAAVGTTGTTINGENYDFAGGAPTGTVSVGSAGAERTVTNVAAGRVSADSTDAVNGSQLFATNNAVESLADEIGDVGETAQNAVQYDRNEDGSRANSVTLVGGDPNTPVVISNVAEGEEETDAVNVA